MRFLFLTCNRLLTTVAFYLRDFGWVDTKENTQAQALELKSMNFHGNLGKSASWIGFRS